jgi:hypothetical protein
MFTSKLEELPPLWVCSSNSEIVSSSIVLNVEGVVGLSWSDSLWLTVEIPKLSLSVIWCF